MKDLKDFEHEDFMNLARLGAARKSGGKRMLVLLMSAKRENMTRQEFLGEIKGLATEIQLNNFLKKFNMTFN